MRLKALRGRAEAAGIESELHVTIVDRFCNDFEAGKQPFPYIFDLSLIPAGGLLCTFDSLISLLRSWSCRPSPNESCSSL